MSFKIDSIEVKGNQLEIDLSIKPTQPMKTYELTFSRESVEAMGIEWDQFVKSVHQVISELRVKGDSEEVKL